MFYTVVSVVCESQTYPSIPSQWIHTQSLSLTHTHRNTRNQSQPARECETPQYLSVSRNLAQALGSSQRLSVWDQRPVKKIQPQNITHTRRHTHTQRLWEVKKCQTGVLGGFVWFGCLPLSDERCHFPSYFMKDEGGGEWLVKEHARWKDARQMSAHTFPPFFFILCAFFILCLCPSSSFLLTSLSRSIIFSLSLWGLEASQTAPSWNGVWKHPGIYQLLLNLLSDCQIPHHSCAHTHMHTYTQHLARVKQPLLSQKIDIKKKKNKKYPSD